MTNDVFIEGIQENVHDNSACILSSVVRFQDMVLCNSFCMNRAIRWTTVCIWRNFLPTLALYHRLQLHMLNTPSGCAT